MAEVHLLNSIEASQRFTKQLVTMIELEYSPFPLFVYSAALDIAVAVYHLSLSITSLFSGYPSILRNQ
jgi:hypothetical protein